MTTDIENWVTNLTDAALADRIGRIAKDIRFYLQHERVALLNEAARRLAAKEPS